MVSLSSAPWWLPSVVAVVFAVVHMHLSASPDAARTVKVFTVAELARYAGADGGPVYLAIMGRVFDVSRGREFYEPGAGYECFAARDASLAFVTGDFANDRTDAVGDLSGRQLAELAGWVNSTYYAKYDYRGILGGGFFYDSSGRETAGGRAVATKIAAAAAAEVVRAADLRRYPKCASRRTATEATVSCKNGAVPRLRDGGDGRDRCACVSPQTARTLPGDFRVYDGCEKTVPSCTLPRPAAKSGGAKPPTG